MNKLIIFIFFIFISLKVNAADQSCSGRSGSALHPLSTDTNKNTIYSIQGTDPIINLTINKSSSIASSMLITCTDTSTKAKTKQGLFYTTLNSNISLSPSITHSSGNTYYKIINTTNNFINTYAYIYFKYSDNNETASRFPIETNSKISADSDPSYSQGLRIHELSFLLTKAPLEAIPETNIIIGTVDVSWVKPNDTFNDTYTTSQSQIAQLSLKITPPATKTCTVNASSVTLPTITAASLANSIGATSGNKNFTISAVCGSSLKSTAFDAIIVDNSDLTSSTNNASIGVLSNVATTGEKANNVAIQLFNADNSTPIEFGTEFSFGTSNTEDSPKVSHDFYAKYYKINNLATEIGKVSSLATIRLMYH